MAKLGNPHKKETRVLRLFHTIRSTADQLDAAALSLLSQSGLTLSQFLVLESLAHSGPMNQKTIGTHIGRSGGNITMVIRNLVKAGYVRQERSGTDGRQRKISMTSEGYVIFMAIYPIFISTYVTIFKSLVGKDQKRLIKLCTSISPTISVNELADDEDVSADEPNSAVS